MLDSLSYRKARRSLMTREIRVGRSYILIGLCKGFGIGFHIDKYTIGLDIGPMYIWLEF
jgi:hypothetical protein